MFDARQTMWAWVVVVAIAALSLLLLHVVGGAPGTVWADIPSILFSKSNPILLAYIALALAGAAASAAVDPGRGRHRAHLQHAQGDWRAPTG